MPMKLHPGCPTTPWSEKSNCCSHDDAVQVPARLVQPLPGGGLFVVPALDARIAVTKLIMDGPTVTARRTAAVSLLAAQYLAPRRSSSLLIVGAGAQG